MALDVVLFSGGVDSLATAIVRPESLLVYVDCGTKYADVELSRASSLVEELRKDSQYQGLEVVRLPLAEFERGQKAYIPYRNLFLVMAAVNHASIVSNVRSFHVWLGGLRDDCVSDKTPNAFSAMASCLRQIGEYEVEVRSPFWFKAKHEVVQDMVHDLGSLRATRLLRLSMSCYRGDDCGDCPSCFRKWAAVTAAGITCADWFKPHPGRTELARHYAIEMRRVDVYDKGRREATLRALRTA